MSGKNQARKLDKQAVLERILQSITNAGWHVVVLVLDTNQQTPYIAASTAPELRITEKPSQALLPETWRHPHFRINRSYLIGTLDEQIQARSTPPAQVHWHKDSALVIPITSGTQELGWFYLRDSKHSKVSLETELPLLESIADHAALLITQIDVQQELNLQIAQQTLLNDISRTISQHLELADLFTSITVQLQKVFTFNRASLSLREGNQPHARLLVKDDRPLASYTVTALETIAVDQLLDTEQSLLVANDLKKQRSLDTERSLLENGIRSYACLPVSMWGHTIGVFCLASTTIAFEDNDRPFLIEVAEHIGVAVWNALLHELEQKRRHLADSLARLSTVVNSTLDLTRVLELALEELSRVIAFDTASILLVEGEALRIGACRGFENPETLLGLSFHVDENNISHHVLQSQEVRVVDDVQTLPEWGHERHDAEGYNRIRAWIGAPLIVRDHSVGLLVLDKLESSFFTDEDGETALAFASHIALAIENARLYETAQAQRDKLAAILTDISDAMIVLDNAQQIWLLNPAAERLFKTHHEDVVGKPLTSLDAPELAAALKEAQTTQTPIMREITGPDGALNASISTVRDVGWVIVMQDITPIKELDRLRTDWVAAVSHDLKNPIQVIQLGAVLIEMDGPLNETQLERVMIIQRSAEQLRNLVTDVLDLARLEAGPSIRLQTIRIQEIAIAALAEIEHLAAKKHQDINTNIEPELPPINGDGVLLQRAIANLLGNAVKYTPVEGSISLDVNQHQQILKIIVSDTGEGIPDNALPNLFNRFYRVPGTDVEGTGLGLSIVKSIIEKHKGTIHVDSVAGRGSTFTIELPLA